MLLLGTRGKSSAALADLLKIDNFFAFNPHQLLKNVTEGTLQDTNDYAAAFANHVFTVMVSKQNNFKVTKISCIKVFIEKNKKYF